MSNVTFLRANAIGVLLIFLIAPAAGATPPGKIIEWGWDCPPCIWMRDHISEMEKLPFDGIVVELHANGHHNPSTRPDRQAAFPSRGWGKKAINRGDFSEAIDALKATKFSRFTDNFLRFNTNPGDVDYFDDAGFNGVVANFRLLATVCKETGMKGIMLDTESYEGVVFNYSRQRGSKEHTYEQYCEKARQRGREMMQAAYEAYPAIRVMVTLTYGLPHGLEGDEPMPKHKYGLLPSVLDGMIEGAGERAMLIDGWEYAYNNRTKQQYDDSLDMLKNRSQAWSAVPELKSKRWHASFGIWIDYNHKWDASNFDKNFFTPQEFAYAVHEALQHSDAYAWIWSEVPSWWNGTMPQAYIDALNEARKPDLSPPPPRKSPF
jgi:hypothetical protein